MAHHRAFFVVMAAACFGCAGPPEENSGAGAPIASDSETIQELALLSQTGLDMFETANSDSVSDLDSFIVLGLRKVGDSYQEIVSNLGPPDSLMTRPFPNRHVPGQVDSTVIAYFKNAQVAIYRVADGSELVSNVTVRDNELLLLPTVTVGASWDSILSMFGTPHYADDPEYRWACSACTVDQQLVLEVAGGRVSSVGFAYYVD